jgi:phosphoglycerate dehydrogenase-like enzyme
VSGIGGTRLRVAALPPPEIIARVFREEDWAALGDAADVVSNTGDRMAPDAAAGLAAGADVVITSWATAPLTPALFDAAPGLRLVAHAAGSVRHIFPPDVLEPYIRARNIPISSSNRAIALNVAEATIGMLITLSRRVVDHTTAFRRDGSWGDHAVSRNYPTLRSGIVGLVSASTVAREVVALLKPFGARVLVYDPYLTAADALALGVERVGLSDLFAQSEFVSVHAPALPATEKLIGADQLRLLRDGAIFFNPSRGAVVDHDALLTEARTGRIVVGLDVTTPEPLPRDSPFRSLANVVITPHETGAGRAGYAAIGKTVLAAVRDVAAGRRPVAGEVDLERWDVLA